ncbi:leucine-rich repeat protein [Aquimarina sp. AU119]|uniref:leucine-rich repeat protein n=1 Tax=Aquimarina sp. AU119 TaxID=2108528 RepID=UPI000D692D4C|nr:leucine-rich repeat protein [Aquimarina sp. AU119]
MKKQSQLITYIIFMIWFGHTTYGQQNVGDQFTVDYIRYKITAIAPLELEVMIVVYEGTATEVDIPETVDHGTNTYTVTAIGENTDAIDSGIPIRPFFEKGLTRVKIPNTVTIIGLGAFNNNQLEEVIIPENVTHIRRWSFGGNRLTEVTIPASVVSIGYQAFVGIARTNPINLVTVEANDPPSLDATAFANRGKNRENIDLVVPKGTLDAYKDPANGWTGFRSINEIVEVVGDTFSADDITYEVTSLDLNKEVTVVDFMDTAPEMEITIPKTINHHGTDYKVTAIGDEAFFIYYINTQTKGPVTKVTFDLPSNVTSIGEDAFYNNQLTSIVIPESVTSLGQRAFGTNQLTEVNIPNSITNISKWAFASNQLTEVTIPASVENIGDQAFHGNVDLDLVTLEASDPPTLHEKAFTSFGISDVRGQIILVVPKGAIGAYEEPANGWTGFRSITNGVFTDDDIKYGIISSTPNKVKAMSYTGSETEVTISPVVIDNSSNTTYTVTAIGDKAFQKKGLTSVSIPNTVTRIEEDAFWENELINVVLPENLTSLGQRAFGTNKLTEVTIPEGVTIISQWTFAQNQLTEVVIPTSVESIGYQAFLGVSSNNPINLVTVEANDPPSLDSTAFANRGKNRENIDLVVPKGTLDAYKDPANGWTGFKSITEHDIGSMLNVHNITYRVTSITPGNEEVMATDYSVTGGTITIPKTINRGSTTYKVNSIGENAFREKVLTEVTFDSPSNVTAIGTRAFATNNLTEVTIPDSVTSIGDNAFQDNDLTSIEIPNSVTSIGAGAFATNDLPRVTIPDGVTSIGDNAFQDNGLISIEIPNSVTSIGVGAFATNDLPRITIPDGVTSIRDNAFQNNQLTRVTIPDGVTNIGDNAFQNNQLTRVTIPDGVTNIGDNAFQNNNLTRGTIPDGVTSIGNNTFQNNNLTRVTIPDGVTSIGNNTFQNNDLTRVTIPENLTSIGASAFADNPNLATVVSMAFSPPSIEINTFTNANRAQIDLTVPSITPAGKIRANYEDAGWTGFRSIKEDIEKEDIEPHLASSLLTDFNRGFSPNSDGIADTLVIEGLEDYKNNMLKIYDLSQRLLYSAHYRGPNDGWDGTHKGSMVPVGSYVCVIDYNEPGLNYEAKMIYVNY